MVSAKYAALAEASGAQVTEDMFERTLCSYDLAPVPNFILKVLRIRNTPELVVKPRTTEQVASILQHAYKHRIAVTPRAGATSALFNAVPVRGGMVMDLKGLDGVMEIDEGKSSALVWAGTTFQALDAELQGKGFTLKSYPSSYLSATVGGWLCSEGLGIGSLRHGPFVGQVRRAEFITPQGKVLHLGPETMPPLAWLQGSEGTLGIVTKVGLSIQRIPASERHHLIAVPDMRAGQELMERTVPLRPYFMAFHGRSFVAALLRAGFDAPPLGQEDLLSLTFQETSRQAAELSSAVAEIVADIGGRELASSLAQEEWRARFYSLRAQRLGPSLLGAESLLPLERFADYLSQVERLDARMRLNLFNYGYVVAPNLVLVFSMFPVDERQGLAFILSLGVVKALQMTAIGQGGRPYGVGLWNTPYVGRVLGASEQRERKARKARLDEEGVMNPGKVYTTRYFLPGPLFMPGMDVLALGHSLHRRLARPLAERPRDSREVCL